MLVLRELIVNLQKLLQVLPNLTSRIFPMRQVMATCLKLSALPLFFLAFFTGVTWDILQISRCFPELKDSLKIISRGSRSWSTKVFRSQSMTPSRSAGTSDLRPEIAFQIHNWFIFTVSILGSSSSSSGRSLHLLNNFTFTICDRTNFAFTLSYFPDVGLEKLWR